MARYGMLRCQANFSFGGQNKNCNVCQTLEEETHRINFFVIYQSVNLYNSNEKLDFELIYSDDVDVLLKVIDIVLKVWELDNGRNATRTN